MWRVGLFPPTLLSPAVVLTHLIVLLGAGMCSRPLAAATFSAATANGLLLMVLQLTLPSAHVASPLFVMSMALIFGVILFLPLYLGSLPPASVAPAPVLEARTSPAVVASSKASAVLPEPPTLPLTLPSAFDKIRTRLPSGGESCSAMRRHTSSIRRIPASLTSPTRMAIRRCG